MLKTFAIVVTFDPDIPRLDEALHALIPQVNKILIVDNGSKDLGRILNLSLLSNKVRVLALEENLGMGAALNFGIEEAFAGHLDAVLLMDQDSIPYPGMVSNLIASLQLAQAQGQKPAAIGPRVFDQYAKRLYRHVVFSGWRIKSIPCNKNKAPLKVDSLITSGSLIPLDALSDIGRFNESLFIDHIDTDWLLRAQLKGRYAYGDCKAIMEHSLGDYSCQFWFGRWRNIPIHKPFRYYYIFRNSIWLQHQSYASIAWKRVETIRLIKIFVFMTLFHSQRIRVLLMIIRGLYDGVHQNMGKLATIL